MQKWFFMLASTMLLASCTTDSDEPSTSDSDSESSISSEESRVEDGREEGSDDVVADSETTLHDFDPLISTETFTNEEGKQAWDAYLAASAAFTYSQFDDESDTNGSTIEEIKELFPELENSETSELDDTISILLYKFNESSGLENEEGATVLSEIAFIFHNQHLVASSVTAGGVSETQEDVLPFEDVVALTTLEELIAEEPHVYSIGEMMHGGTMYRQVMIPTVAKLQDNSEQVVATYLNFDGNLQNGYNATNLEDAGQDLMWYSYLSFKDYVENYLSKSS